MKMTGKITVTAEDLQNELKKYCSSLVVITSNDSEAIDIECPFIDKSYQVFYDFRVHKYGRAWGSLTPIQLIQVRSVIDDYLRAIGSEKYVGQFEVDNTLKPVIKRLNPEDLKQDNQHKANIFIYTYNDEITERHEVDNYEIDDNIVIATEDGEKWIYPLTSICSIEVPNNDNYSNIHGNCSD